MILKKKLYNHCSIFLNKRLEVIQKSITDIEKGLRSETKSSAGDKHETGRAMLQLEREKVGQQLAEVQKLQELLQKIDLKTNHKKVVLGSIVFTSTQNYYIAISAGELKIENEIFYAISAATPIGKLLLSKQEGEHFQFRNQDITILKVL